MYVIRRLRDDGEWVYMNCYRKYSEALLARDTFEKKYGGKYLISWEEE